MVVTCSLPDQAQVKVAAADSATAHAHKGTARCSHCGSEADIWLEDA
jgi:hypothetical protein